MKSIWYDSLGPAAEVLQYGELPDPTPAAGEVIVEVAASGVNPIDVKRRRGGRGGMSAKRVVPHFDGAGTIVAVGEKVDAKRVGERVWLFEAQWQRDYGTAAELVAVAADRAVSLPENTSFAEGACLGIPALTAYGAVFGDGDISGQTVLVTGGAGAVGHYAVQMAKLAGARQVIATVSSESKAKLAAATDAGAVINYRTDDVAARGMEVTGGHGVDRIIEVEFGGNLAASLALLRAGGTIATYASEAVPEPSVPFYSMLYKSIRVEHILVFQLAEELKHAACADITRWLSAGELIHQVGPQFPLADTIAAHQAVENHAQGKVIVLPRGAND